MRILAFTVTKSLNRAMQSDRTIAVGAAVDGFASLIQSEGLVRHPLFFMFKFAADYLSHASAGIKKQKVTTLPDGEQR